MKDSFLEKKKKIIIIIIQHFAIILGYNHLISVQIIKLALRGYSAIYFPGHMTFHFPFNYPFFFFSANGTPDGLVINLCDCLFFSL